MNLKKLQNILLYLFAFTLVFENWSLMSISGNSIPKIISYIFVFITILNIKFKINNILIKKYIYPLLWFLIVMILSFILNFNYDYLSLWIIQTISLNVFFFMIIASILVSEPWVGYNMFVSLNLGIFTSALMYMIKIGVEYSEDRMTIYGENSNRLGIFCVISIMFILSLIFENKAKLSGKRYLLFLFLVPLINMIAETGSRVAFLGLMLSLMIFFLFQNKRKLRTKLFVGVLGLISLLIVYNYLMSFGILNERLLNSIETGDISGRDRIWNLIIPQILENPIFGLGPNGYTKIAIDNFGGYFSPHNVFIEILAYSGIIGLIFFIIFFYRIFKSSIQIYLKKSYILPTLLLVLIFFIFFSGQGLNSKPFWLIYSYVIAEFIKYKIEIEANSKLKTART